MRSRGENMTHSIVLEVPEYIYQPLAEEAEAKGRKVEEIALEMLDLLATDRKLGDDEFERLANLLADEFEKRLPKDFKPLSDYAMSREGIYEDHL
jgi:hypothetical protein